MKSEHKEMMKARRRNIKLTLSYDGTNYHGFQRQTKVVAVQNVLEGALFKLFGDSIELAAAGRTDAGVHAIGQVVNFFTDGTIPIQNVVRAGNRLLPDDIVLLKAEEADRDFSALHSVKSKIYIYKVFENELADPFMSRFYWHVNKKLNLEDMQEALKYIDYDLDLKVFPDGNYRILDQEEYRQHAREMGYSDELDKILKKQLDVLIDLAVKKGGPFDQNFTKKWYSFYQDLKEGYYGKSDYYK